MCLLFRLSKYISVPVICEWLGAADILLLDTSLVNQIYRPKLLLIYEDYSHQLCKSLFPSNKELTALVLCGWSLKNLCPLPVSCVVTLNHYDLLRIKDYGWQDAFNNVVRKVTNFAVENIKFKSEDFHILSKEFENLESLRISSTIDPCVVEGFALCSQLRSLSFGSFSFLTDKLSTALIRLFRLCSQLESLNLESLRDQKILLAIAVHCKKLTKFKCRGVVRKRKSFEVFAIHLRAHLIDFEVEYYDIKQLRNMIWYKGKTLQTLSLDCRGIFDPRYSTFNVRHLTAACPELQNISLFGKVYMASADDLLSVVSNCNQLIKELYLDEFDAADIVKLVSICPQLRKFNSWSDINNDQLLAIFQSCSLLESLKLHETKLLTTGYLQLIAPYCRKLTYLALDDCAVGISKTDIYFVEKYLQKLENVTIAIETIDFMDVCLCLLKIESLRKLSIMGRGVSNCVEGELFERSEAFVSNVTSLFLSGVQINDSGMFVILSHCRYLSYLNVYGNSLWTSRGFNRSAPYLRKIRGLDVRMCKLLNDNIVDSLCVHCKRLEKIDADRTGLSKIGMFRAGRGCYSLQSVNNESSDHNVAKVIMGILILIWIWGMYNFILHKLDHEEKWQQQQQLQASQLLNTSNVNEV